ncbi:MAG: hypothetical protein P4M11_04195 [Candidatus Pacebacteria bacterium]|nr:hypothetical protein [Candidatus Paceibacterota bacterium]
MTLMKYLTQNYEKRFKHLPYLPWTSNPDHNPHLALTSSDLIPGCLGVVSKIRIKNQTWQSNYPGLLLTEGMQREYEEDFYCPTGVSVVALNFEVEANSEMARALLVPDGETTAKMVIIGDPRMAGAMFNSPYGLNPPRTPNLRMAECLKKDRASFIKKSSNSKFEVDAHIIRIFCIRPSIEADEELFIQYDVAELGLRELEDDGEFVDESAGNYWDIHLAALETDAHCGICMERHCVESNPLYQCSWREVQSGGEVKLCSNSRHQRCFEASDTSYRAHTWFCPKHSVGYGPMAIYSASPLDASPPPAARYPKKQLPNSLPDDIGPVNSKAIPTAVSTSSPGSAASLAGRKTSSHEAPLAISLTNPAAASPPPAARYPKKQLPNSLPVEIPPLNSKAIPVAASVNRQNSSSSSRQVRQTNN